MRSFIWEAHDERAKHIRSGGLIRPFVFGFNDGLVTNLGIVTAFAGASVGTFFIILAALAEMFAGAISMALGEYLSTKSQTEFYKREIERERKEVREIPEAERDEIRKIYAKKGFQGAELEMVVSRITANPETWVRIMATEELGLPEHFENPKRTAIVMSVAYLMGSAVPTIPYLLLSPNIALQYSIGLSVIALFAAGASKTVLTGTNWIKSGLEQLAVGLIAAVAAYLIGANFPKP